MRSGPRKPGHRRGQSFVELALFFPIILLMLVIVIDAGFLMYHYLTILDATREGARYGASIDPFLNPDIYDRICNGVVMPLAQDVMIDTEPGDLDIVVSIFSVGTSGGVPVVTARYPDDDGWSLNTEGGRTGTSRVSAFSIADVDTRLQAMPGSPDTGVLLVEIWFDDHTMISVPFISAATALDPITLHAYTFMPITKATP